MLNPHQHNDRSAHAGERAPIGLLMPFSMPGYHGHRSSETPMRDRDTGYRWSRQRRTETGHNCVLDPRSFECCGFFTATTEQERISALQAHDGSL